MATLTYVYSDSTAVVGPLATVREPHSWDLCLGHASRITAPRGWDLVRHAAPLPTNPDEDDLVALADAVREGGVAASPPVTGFSDPDRVRRSLMAPARPRASATVGRAAICGSPDSDQRAPVAVSHSRPAPTAGGLGRRPRVR